MILRYRKLRTNALAPRRAHPTDAGLDLAPTEHYNIEPRRTVKLGTGIAVRIPDGHVGIITARSSATARALHITGVIDAGYVGEVFLCVTNIGEQWQEISREQYLAQLLILPCITPALELVDELEPSARGTGGFGSTGS